MTSARELAQQITRANFSPVDTLREHGHARGERLARMIVDGYVHTVTPKGRAELLATATWIKFARAHLREVQGPGAERRPIVPDELAADYTADDWRRFPSVRAQWAYRQASIDFKAWRAARQETR